MWKEYTRETPARPGFAIMAAVLALAGTTGLAQYFTTQKSRIQIAGVRADLPGWPISFTVPKGFRPAATTSNWDELDSADGIKGSIAFEKSSTFAREMWMQIEYRVVPASMSIDRVYRRLTKEALGDGEEIEIGPLTGVSKTGLTEKGSVLLRALARTEEGLVVMVSLDAMEDSPRVRRVLTSVCESVQFKEWVVRQH
ncbi:MAG: hypothetical protein AABZ08_05830 [Planctomycetota bacterium]